MAHLEVLGTYQVVVVPLVPNLQEVLEGHENHVVEAHVDRKAHQVGVVVEVSSYQDVGHVVDGPLGDVVVVLYLPYNN